MGLQPGAFELWSDAFATTCAAPRHVDLRQEVRERAHGHGLGGAAVAHDQAAPDARVRCVGGCVYSAGCV